MILFGLIWSYVVFLIKKKIFLSLLGLLMTGVSYNQMQVILQTHLKNFEVSSQRIY